jgi:hypothetical protein
LEEVMADALLENELEYQFDREIALIDEVIATREVKIRRMMETACAERVVSDCSSLSTVSSSRYEDLERD